MFTGYFGTSHYFASKTWKDALALWWSIAIRGMDPKTEGTWMDQGSRMVKIYLFFYYTCNIMELYY